MILQILRDFPAFFFPSRHDPGMVEVLELKDVGWNQNILMLYIPLTANTCTLDLRNKEHLLIITSGGSIW